MIEVQQSGERAATASAASGGGQAGEAASAGLAQLFAALLASAVLAEAPASEDSQALVEGGEDAASSAGEETESSADAGARFGDSSSNGNAAEQGDPSSEKTAIARLDMERPDVEEAIPLPTPKASEDTRRTNSEAPAIPVVESEVPEQAPQQNSAPPAQEAEVRRDSSSTNTAPTRTLLTKTLPSEARPTQPPAHPGLTAEAETPVHVDSSTEAPREASREKGEVPRHVLGVDPASQAVETARKQPTSEQVKPEIVSEKIHIQKDFAVDEKISHDALVERAESTDLDAPELVTSEATEAEPRAPREARHEAPLVVDAGYGEEGAETVRQDLRVDDPAPAPRFRSQANETRAVEEARPKPFAAAPETAPKPLREGVHEAGRVRVETGAGPETQADIQRISTAFPQQATAPANEELTVARAATAPPQKAPRPERPRRASEPQPSERSRSTDSRAGKPAPELGQAKSATALLGDSGRDSGTGSGTEPDQQAPKQDEVDLPKQTTAERTRAEIARLAATGGSTAAGPAVAKEQPPVAPAPAAETTPQAAPLAAAAPEPELAAARPTAPAPAAVTAAGGSSAQAHSAPAMREAAPAPEPAAPAEGAQFRRVEAMLDARPNETHRLQLVVHDDQLGRVSVRLVERAGLIDAMLRADRPGTAKQLTDSLSGLTELLTRGRGLDAGVGRTDRSESGGNADRESGREADRHDSNRQESGRDEPNRRDGQRRRDQPADERAFAPRTSTRRGERPEFSLESALQGA